MDSIVLEANASGRLWSENPEAWEELCSPGGCPHCRDDQRRGMIAETDLVWISAWPEAALPGYVCIFSKVHAIEPFDLSEADQARFFLDCMAVARGIARALTPVKMNYEIHGNTLPHLHMHLFPRAANDVYVGYPNHCRMVFRRTEGQIAQIKEAVAQSLGPRLIAS